MRGIGLAERFGFFSALMRGVAFLTPKRWLTPVIVFVGANSSVASDAGNIILPPFAAALFLAAVLGVIWTVSLLGWYALGLPLGPGAPLHFSPDG
jgi:p-aminobenzoyl-glutamate transporter AbgT